MKVIDYKNYEITIHNRNIVKFINQWKHYPLRFKVGGFFIWLCWFWNYSMCDAWKDSGMRLLGCEITIRKYSLRD